jgi:predicted phage baseplate assembly protein
VEVVQGETERVTLGSGDGSTPHIRLAVYNRAPLLHIDEADGSDPEPSIEVLIDGAPWSRVGDLDRAGPRDRVFRLDIEADGRAFVAFGDGVHGAVPPPGINNIVAVLHTGRGEAGNLLAGDVDKLLDGNLAVHKTWNLDEASGGRKAETADMAREALLARSAGLDRIVSIDDAARVALEVGEVLHARVDPTAPEGTLKLVVALQGRRKATKALLAALRERIEARMPAAAGIRLEIEGAKEVPVVVEVEITTGAGAASHEVLAALRRAFGPAAGGFFAAERWPVGEMLRRGDVYEAIYAVQGVAAARIAQLMKDEVGKPRTAEETIDPGPDGVIRCEPEHGGITFKTSHGGAS